MPRLLAALVLGLGLNAWGASPVFNVLDYGARNDGSALATEPFRAAIQAAKAAGGGTVFVPAGRYITGPIELVSNLTLYFDAGAVVQFPALASSTTSNPVFSILKSPLRGASKRHSLSIDLLIGHSHPQNPGIPGGLDSSV